MKSLLFSASLLLLFGLSSCGETLEVLDWVDKAQDEAQEINKTTTLCIALNCTVKVREGEIQAVYPSPLREYEWNEGQCNEVFQFIRDYLVGKKVKDRSGEYEYDFKVMKHRLWQ